MNVDSHTFEPWTLQLAKSNTPADSQPSLTNHSSPNIRIVKVYTVTVTDREMEQA